MKKITFLLTTLLCAFLSIKAENTNKEELETAQVLGTAHSDTLSSNAKLALVLWPDIIPPMYPRWNEGDTLMGFDPNILTYTIGVFPSEKKVPHLQFIPADRKARVTMDRAQNLRGSIEARTTTVHVLAEDDSTSLSYRFIFEPEFCCGPQPSNSEPIFSEFLWSYEREAWVIEIYNPGNEAIDMTRYAILKDESGNLTWQEIIENLPPSWNNDGGLHIYDSFYVPGRRWKNDASQAEWEMKPNSSNPTAGAGFLRLDDEEYKICRPNDVWVLSTSTHPNHEKLRDVSDFVFTGESGTPSQYAWSDSTFLNKQANPCWNKARNHYYLVKILNDSILDGTLSVQTDVSSNYQLIDRFDAMGDSLAGKWINNTNEGMKNDWVCRRKPNALYPTTEKIGGGKETAQSSEWMVYRKGDPDFNSDFSEDYDISCGIGHHTAEPMTRYISTLTSSVLLVDIGHKGNLKILGNIDAYTPVSIMEVLDTLLGQTLIFKRDGELIAANTNLADGDSLTVTSADGLNQTIYQLSYYPLSNDVSLTAKHGSGLSISGTVVSGVQIGTTIVELLSKLSVNDYSVLEIEDADGGLQPEKRIHGFDNVIYEQVVNSNVKLAVRAQNGDKAVYSLDFGFSENDAYLFSTIFPIDQETKLITVFPQGFTPKSMMQYIYPNEGATYRVIGDNGVERTAGLVEREDKIEVSSKDGSRTVNYYFGDNSSAIDEDQAALDQVFVFPNPTKDRLYIKGTDVKLAEVYTLSGQLLIEDSVSAGFIDLNGLDKGMYIIKIEHSSGAISALKFVME